MKILLADKCSLFREGVIHVLRSIDPDAEIIEAGDYDQVLQHTEQQSNIELLLLGLTLPRQHGLQTLTDVRVRVPNATIIVLAEFERFDDILDTLENGADSYIAKSCSIETISSAIKLFMSSGVYLLPLSARRQYGAGYNATGGWHRHGDRRVAPSRSSARLTKRQLEVLQLVMQGMTNKRIGQVLTISDKTVKTHVTTILRFLDASNRTEAGMLAAMLGLTPISTRITENLRAIGKTSQSDLNNETRARTSARWLR